MTLMPVAATDRLYDLSLFGTYRDFDTIDPQLRRQICGAPQSLRNTPGQFVHGHVALKTLTDVQPEAQRFTLLREPTSRLLSHWLFWRQFTNEEAAPWGSWGERMKKSRGPLVDFLQEPSLACQTDNLTLRMLLWPHPLLPDHGFIDPAHDAQLLRDVTERLARFDFVDIVDGGKFLKRFESWLGLPIHYHRENETRRIAAEYRAPLHAELTPHGFDLLDARSRLDLHIWRLIAGRNIPSQDVSRLREQTLLANVARYGVLIAA